MGKPCQSLQKVGKHLFFLLRSFVVQCVQMFKGGDGEPCVEMFKCSKVENHMCSTTKPLNWKTALKR